MKFNFKIYLFLLFRFLGHTEGITTSWSDANWEKPSGSCLWCQIHPI